MRAAGVNHFSWLLKAEYDGRDVAPEIVEAIRREAVAETTGDDIGAKIKFNNTIAYTLYQAFGYVPMVVGHTKEYVRFWQGLGRKPEPIPSLSIWKTEPRYKIHDAMWKQVNDFITGSIPISDYMTSFGTDLATDIIDSMVGDLDKPFYINTFNEGAVANMADDAFIEILCDVDTDGCTLKNSVREKGI